MSENDEDRPGLRERIAWKLIRLREWFWRRAANGLCLWRGHIWDERSIRVETARNAADFTSMVLVSRLCARCHRHMLVPVLSGAWGAGISISFANPPSPTMPSVKLTESENRNA